jgi:hypothetical protein
MAQRKTLPKRRKALPRITLRTLLTHMQKQHGDVLVRFSRVDKRMDGIDHRLAALEGRVDTLTHRFDVLQHKFDVLENKFDAAIPNIDARLDRIEIAIIEQRHEERIVRLEKHVGFATKR